MKGLLITLDDKEHKKLNKLKGNLTWKEYLMRIDLE